MATALTRADTRVLLPTIRVPALLIWGDADARSPMTVAHHMHDAIPDSRLVVIAGAGHVSNLEAPARFDAAARDLFVGLDRVTARQLVRQSVRRRRGPPPPESIAAEGLWQAAQAPRGAVDRSDDGFRKRRA